MFVPSVDTLNRVCAFAPVDEPRIVTVSGLLIAVVVTVTDEPIGALSAMLVVSVPCIQAGAVK